MRFRSAPRPAAAAVGVLAERLAPQTPLARIQRAWPGVVGPALAREATPIAEHTGTVTVQCSSTAWAHEITLLSPTLTAALNTAAGAELVVALRASTLGQRRAR